MSLTALIPTLTQLTLTCSCEEIVATEDPRAPTPTPAQEKDGLKEDGIKRKLADQDDLKMLKVGFERKNGRSMMLTPLVCPSIEGHAEKNPSIPKKL